jgi:hypothetical protein
MFICLYVIFCSLLDDGHACKFPSPEYQNHAIDNIQLCERNRISLLWQLHRPQYPLSLPSIVCGAWSQRLSFANPLFPDKDSVTLTLIPHNSTKNKTVKVHTPVDTQTPHVYSNSECIQFEYRASYLGAPFIDSPSYCQANCAVNEETNGVDLYRASAGSVKRELLERKRQPIANISAAPAQAVGLPSPY